MDNHFFAQALPEVAVVAAHKNVYLPEGEPEAVLRYALKDIPRKTVKQALQKNDKACWAVSFALNHALDVLAMKRLIMISRAICKMLLPDDAALVLEAEASLKRRFANDTAPTMESGAIQLRKLPTIFARQSPTKTSRPSKFPMTLPMSRCEASLSPVNRSQQNDQQQ
ncbi:hypothetical protein ACH79_40195 [Bradyrhizobium sp. CCBAU 051011]|nr:hypothetical protein ACH79_40195 [Bradyrhizobium sp. CCBAU 051011]